ncbi:bifunctional proline dehydrogenase/L-glutamate gamma-semialdehyde dehydrogenase PutA [Aquariibacter albus]|uniref:Bifunctional protein PutA n=1 Tax=Aquariibacter albus TaxID=2759899 RepID=A0A839HU49_9BURK|nr:bifunctional proline dehydrogenase/L-glutamate gamma-semialdehyde dehydrogenase PutA [Aquariibacter albus]MBB1162971.1 bifunctional proline dehydrogenase/L-glutamate gamma-semialdehyde dehydrogenase PutA [Aquariibacter albus]
MPALPPDRLPHPQRDAATAREALVARLGPLPDREALRARARGWIETLRAAPPAPWAVETLLREFPLSRPEGQALMRLAEALLRVPDAATALALTADQLGHADFAAPAGHAAPALARLGAQALQLAQALLPDGEPAGAPLWRRLGGAGVVAAALRGVQLLGRQFVLGRTLDEALVEAARLRRSQPPGAPPLRFSFDMLGEGARGEADAQHHAQAYQAAARRLAEGTTRGPGGAAGRDSLSVKLSALHPRFEALQGTRVVGELVDRLRPLLDTVATAGLGLTIDAEESERLEGQLGVLEGLIDHAARRHPGWDGLGLAVQAYQTRVLATVDTLAELACRAPVPGGLALNVRLVKGAYWDAEIGRAQALGLAEFPVWARKADTDLAYLAAARALIGHAPRLRPQFATHNALSLAAVAALAADAGLAPAELELQRLHGMGEALHRLRQAEPDAPPLRVYAPVGGHRELLAYLVRRLLENGANAAFVHQLGDPAVPLDVLLRLPDDIAPAEDPQPPPVRGPALLQDLGPTPRRNARGLDLAVAAEFAPLLARFEQAHAPQADGRPTLPPAPADTPWAAADTALATLHAAQPAWDAVPVARRAAVLDALADALEADPAPWCALLVAEARKTWPDALAEWRETIDFARHYAVSARQLFAPRALPVPSGEQNTLRLHGRGVWLCISPWNFPLAIFAGQLLAALVAGNTVAAKPAEATPRIAQALVDTLHRVLRAQGLPTAVVHLLPGPGPRLGAALAADARVAGVAFTGSTATAKALQRTLAARPGPIVPLIAETGGVNAMIVDSTALPEQVIDAVLHSSFRSAGQRCSALRLLCLQAETAEPLLAQLEDAMRSLRLGAPEDPATDVGPVIDARAAARLAEQAARLDALGPCRLRLPRPAGSPPELVAPGLWALRRVADLQEEIFGPLLAVTRWGPGTEAPDLDALLDQIQALGWGLTLGLQSRIDGRAAHLAQRLRIGNVYVNRPMTGAVVGMQPFGGEGLSGTGPKAGGPYTLLRYASERVLTVNRAAAGGDLGLLAGGWARHTAGHAPPDP